MGNIGEFGSDYFGTETDSAIQQAMASVSAAMSGKKQPQVQGIAAGIQNVLSALGSVPASPVKANPKGPIASMTAVMGAIGNSISAAMLHPHATPAVQLKGIQALLGGAASDAAAVAAFQAISGTKPTGKLDAKTAGAIAKAVTLLNANW
jgi:hypothetical protein